MRKNRIYYLDNNATTRVADEVYEAMLPFFGNLYGNPSSMHHFGGQVQKYINESREKLAALLGASSQEIIFTSCGSESDSTAIWSALRVCPEKKHIVTTRVEHPAVLSLAKHLEKIGYEVTYLPVDNDGNIDLDELRNSIREDTAIVSVMWANNETGVICPVEEAAEITKSKGAIFHTDAVQAAGKVPINMANSAIDMLSVSGHKFHAPKGVGALYVRKSVPFSPLIIGGHQENGRRAGTENVPYIVGLGKAAELAAKNIETENSKVSKLRDKLENGILKKIDNARINGKRDKRTPNTTNVSFKYVEGESILIMLSEENIAVSTGSACSSGSLEPSHVLLAMNVPKEYVHGSIRFSLSVYNTEEEVDYVLDKLTAVIKRLRDMSPFSDEKSAFGNEVHH